MKNLWRKISSFVFASLMCLMMSALAEAGIVTDRFPIQMYAETQLSTYNSIGAARRAGYADGGTDLIRVTSISNGWLRVAHPGAGGKTVNRWCKANELFADPGYSNRGANVRGAQTVYRTSTSGTKFGSVSNNESVIVLAERNNRAQILYRLDNGTGYKVGWVARSAVNPDPTPAPSNQGHNPEGYLDSVVSNGRNQITVTGWAFDRDDVNRQLDIHVYVGGGTGSGAESHRIVANKHRPDVNRAFPGVGDYHGFQDTINVTRTGNQPVYVYAINIGGGNSNPELGHPTVNIQGQIPGGLDAAGVLDYNNNHYVLYNMGTTWQSAKDLCERQTYNGKKGHLVTITSAGEQSAVENLVRSKGNKNSYWMGGYRNGNNWAWITGEAFSYSHWAGRQPDNYLGREDRLMMYRSTGNGCPLGTWNDVAADGTCNGEVFFGSNNFGFICEFDGETVPPGSQPYQATARQTGPAFRDAGLTQRTSNERVDAGDVCTILKKEGNAWFVDYPAGNTRKQRWVDKTIFEPGPVPPSPDNIKARLEQLANNTNGYRMGTKYTGSGQCRGFANKVYMATFNGVQYIGGYANSNYSASSYAGSYEAGRLFNFSNRDANAVKNLFSKAKIGAFVQMGRRYSLNSTKTAPSPHSAIVYSISDSGVQFYEANTDGKNTIKVNTYTWAQLADKNKGFTIYLPNNYSLK